MMEMAILPSTQIHRLIWLSGLKSVVYGVGLMTSKVLGAIRRAHGAEEQYAADDALLVIRIQKNSCQIIPMILL